MRIGRGFIAFCDAGYYLLIPDTGYGLLDAGYWLRVARCGLRVAGLRSLSSVL